MLFTARAALRLILALGVATAVSGNSYYDDDSVAAREYDDDYSLSARGYYDEFGARSIEHSYQTRGFADGGDFVLSARDLAKLGVRADDVSHVLVLRTLTAAERTRLEGIIKDYEKKVKEIKPKISTAKTAMQAAAKATPKDEAKIKKTSKDYSDLVQMKLGYEQEIEETRHLLK